MNAASKLRELRNAVQNPLSEASALLWLRGAEEAVANRHYSAAHDRLMHAIIGLGDANVSDSDKQRLGEVAIEVAIRSGEVAHCREALNGKARDWIGLNDAVEEILGRVLQFVPAEPNAEEICDTFVHGFPRRSWPRFARGDVRERAGKSGALTDFIDAADGFSKQNDETLVARALSRAATRAFLVGDHDQGRKIARRVNRDLLSLRERLWMTIGWARSPSWLDHVRGIDTLEDIHDALLSDRIPEHVLTLPEYSETSVTFFSRLPFEMTDGALGRLEEVGQLPGADASYRVRAAIAERNLEEDVLGPYLKFRPVFSGHALGDDPISRFVRAQKYLDIEAVNEAVADLERAIETEGIRAFPIATVIREALKIEDESLDRAQLTRIFSRFCEEGRTPSYGWVALSTALAQQKYRRAATDACRRAHSEGALQTSELGEVAVGRSLDWAIREGSPSDLRFWLQTAQES